MNTTPLDTQMILSLSFAGLLLLVGAAFAWSSRRRSIKHHHATVPVRHNDHLPAMNDSTPASIRRIFASKPSVPIMPRLENLVKIYPGRTATWYRKQLSHDRYVTELPSVKQVTWMLKLLCNNHHTVTVTKPKRRQNGVHVPERLRRKGTRFFPVMSSSY